MKSLSGRVSGNDGFSMVEALIVILVVAVVGGIGFFLYARQHQAHATGWTTISASPSYASVKLLGCKNVVSSTETLVYLRLTRSSSSIRDFYAQAEYTDGSITSLIKGSAWSNNVSTVRLTLTKKVYFVQSYFRVNTSSTPVKHNFHDAMTNSSYGEPGALLLTTCSSGAGL